MFNSKLFLQVYGGSLKNGLAKHLIATQGSETLTRMNWSWYNIARRQHTRKKQAHAGIRVATVGELPTVNNSGTFSCVYNHT